MKYTRRGADALIVFQLLAIVALSFFCKQTDALRAGGLNVCSKQVRFVRYYAPMTRYRTRTTTYTICYRRFIWCTEYQTRYRSKSVRTTTYYAVYGYKTEYYCCNGWRQSGNECPNAICDRSCNNGRCVRPNVCRCYRGYKGTYCSTDINECATSNPCEHYCVNNHGSYKCQCKSGFTLGTNGKCSDINECNDKSKNWCDQKCVNTPGSFYCSCNSGFQLKSDRRRCAECPAGTYKEESGTQKCKPCPANALTRRTGSTSFKDCYCKPGFPNTSRNGGVKCVRGSCIQLSNTLKNGKITECNSYKFGDTCKFTCNDHHHIANEKSTTRTLTCTSSLKWSHDIPQCIESKCQRPPVNPRLKFICDGFNIGDKCLHICDKGYEVVGIAERTCLGDFTWSGKLPYCKIKTCPQLPQTKNVIIRPHECLTKKTNYNDACTQSCMEGYEFMSGDEKRVCSQDSSWTGSKLICKDVQAPTIKCPEDITAEAQKGLNFTEISFEMPTVSDNIDTAENIKISKYPHYISSPYNFTIGVTTMKFTATDSAGNSVSCLFEVDIKDREAPTFLYCPKDIEATTSSLKSENTTVSWKNPTFIDNSGKVDISYRSHNNPVSLVAGDSTKVAYVITDPSNNNASCMFNIHVEARSCPKRDPPINGALACNHLTRGSVRCTVSCQIPYSFNGPFARQYLCTENLEWEAIPGRINGKQISSMWPDCTEKKNPKGSRKALQFYYFTGNCSESDNANNEILKDFQIVFIKMLQRQRRCRGASKEQYCQAKNAKVTCGKKTLASLKRSIELSSIQIDIEVELLSKEDADAQEQTLNEITNVFKDVHKRNSSDAHQLKSLRVQNKSLSLDEVESSRKVIFSCPDGSIFKRTEELVNETFESKRMCVSCLAGTYFNQSEKNCITCPKGTYSELPGSLQCKQCPLETTTLKNGTSRKTMCKERCRPGSFSKTGLQDCKACPKDKYQSNHGSTTCNKCPGITKTLLEGTSNIEDCLLPCPEGTFSKSGLMPCSPCPQGFYQSRKHSKSCVACGEYFTTDTAGASDKSECKSTNVCSSGPCLNGGICKGNNLTFTCECLTGYKGQRCEEEINDCLTSSCFGDAVCLDKIGKFKCICPGGYSDQRCSTRAPEYISVCSNNLLNCQQNCFDTKDGQECNCRPGFLVDRNNLKLCLRVKCPALGKIIDGVISSHNGFYGASVSYSCNTGFQLNGPRERICQADGQWSGKAPVCQAKCGSLPNLINGKSSLANDNLGLFYKFSCLSGFLLIGSQKRYCQENGKWSQSQPRCAKYHCKPVNAPLNGKIIGSSYEEGATLIVKCDTGFMLENSNSAFLTCQSNRHWSREVPKCKLIQCPILESIANGLINVTANILDSKAVYTCKSGMTLVGSNIRVCQNNAKWSGKQPICKLVDCKSPGQLAHGKVNGKFFGLGDKVTYTCNSGYKLLGIFERECLINDTWSGVPPTCEEVLCDVPKSPINGVAKWTSRKFQSKVTYKCLAGYVLKGDLFRTCNERGQWSRSLPTCSEVLCDIPKSPIYGEAKWTSRKFQSKVTYKCLAGYVLKGDLFRTCNERGQWSGSLPTCSEVLCDVPKSPIYGEAKWTSRKFQSKVTYNCLAGYVLKGDLFRTCNERGQWSGSLPACSDEIVISNFSTDGLWGDWGHSAFCPSGQFVYGYRVKQQGYCGDSCDNTALNDIELHCSKKDQAGPYTKIYSKYTTWGNFSPFFYCSGTGNPINGFDMKFQEDQGNGDDSAANRVDFYCLNGGYIAAYTGKTLGNWISPLKCPMGQAVIGIITRVDSKQNGDKTALNGVRLHCKKY